MGSISKAGGKEGKTIVLTGGHAATTAIAVIEELIRRKDKGKYSEFYWIGAKSSLEGKKVLPIEVGVFQKLGIKNYQIISGKLQTKFTRWTIPAFLKFPIGFIQASIILLKIKPDCILSFGGFSALPVVFWGKLMGAKIILHEQTSVIGRANKLSSYFADKVLLAQKESQKYYSVKKTTIVGNPVMTQITEIAPKNEIGKMPTIFVMGGSRGSQIINTTLKEILPILLNRYFLLHITGPLDYEKYFHFRKTLPLKIRDRYEIYSVVDPLEVDNLYRQADIVVSRAGANTVAEIMVTKRPSILIPIPWSFHNEQVENAKIVEKYGLAKIISQDELTGDLLLKKIADVTAHWQEIVNKVPKKENQNIQASKMIVDILEKMV